MAHFLSLVPVDAVLAHISGFQALETETLPLEHCLGRILAQPFLAPEDLPGFNRSTMDGFAVQARDVFGASEGLPALLDYTGECHMGSIPEHTVECGTTTRIWTGGMLPEGADAVVMLEYARKAGEKQIELTRPVAPGENIIMHDEDAAKNDQLIPAGRKIRPYEMGLFAALGQEAVTVYRRPKVAVISTGDEVVPVSATPAPGQVRDVNSTALVAQATQWGAEARAFGLVQDDPEALRLHVEKALAWADVVLLSGGSSAGQRDYTLGILAGLPDSSIFCHGVAISPGKPLIVAQCGKKSLWGLPGHVASALVCAHVFIRPLLHTLSGLQKKDSFIYRQIKATLTRSVASTQGRRDYIRVALEQPEKPDEPMLARPVRGKSGLITTLVQAQALVICPESQEGLNAGQLVDVYLLS